ncbi:unnamed protein product [Polarella glacialis]|uniref:Nudix hydrolase domain-containing protein n=1 Tax=Polarella glacialis TaxID=89957 RepID=A0A813HMW9_POLGL|nr:unnamed protein product [Polarella glacialis]
MAQKAQVVSSETFKPPNFRWMQLRLLTYVDVTGRTRKWEMAERSHANKTEGSAVDGVFVVATIHYPVSRLPPELLLIKQFRPPMNKDVIEFVAGLVDKGETPEVAALRELKEETGFVKGSIRGVTSPMPMDPGMSNSQVAMVLVDIDGDDAENRKPIASPEDGEHITASVWLTTLYFSFILSPTCLEGLFMACLCLFKLCGTYSNQKDTPFANSGMADVKKEYGVIRQVSIDRSTSVPHELYWELVRAGEKAKRRGQHELKAASFSFSSENKKLVLMKSATL